ncbi:hypothetical protein [Streptomyces phytophilus]|uniref:hypothetical protein n=1 Tax=Streptomyces phytophilus TaxID=722715 RepID=UPI0015F12408|nr:hypothetical protein [Streptomyces phytophilus]
MRTVRAAVDKQRFDDAEQAKAPAADILAALTQLDEAGAALVEPPRRLLERRRRPPRAHLAHQRPVPVRTPGARRRQPAPRPLPGRLRADRARDRTGNAWCRADERQPREALGDLSTFNDTWPDLARAATSDTLSAWVRDLDGPALAARLPILRLVPSQPVPDGAVASHPEPADALRRSALAPLDEHLDARLSVDLPEPRTTEQASSVR